MDNHCYTHFIFRKEEHNKYKENKIETETPIHTDETTTEKILMLNKSFDDIVSQPFQTENVVKSDCKIKFKLTHNIQEISAGKPTNVTHLRRLQLPSEQYINIFNRYQVFHTIIIFNHWVSLMIIFNYY